MSANGIGALEPGDRRTPQHETLTPLSQAPALSADERRTFEVTAARQPPARLPSAAASPGPAHALRSNNLPLRLKEPSLGALLAHLKVTRTLRILNNCEHVIGEAAIVADALLRGCAGVRILATSREPLRIAGKFTCRLPSLGVPSRCNSTASC